MTAKNFITKLQVSLDGNKIEVKWKDGHIGRFHAKWLRFNCFCNKCKPDVPGVYVLDIGKFPDTLIMTEAKLKTVEEKGSSVCDDVKSTSLYTFTTLLGTFYVIQKKDTTNEINQLRVKYQDEVFHDHVTLIPSDWLRQKCYCDSCLLGKIDKSDVITRSLQRRSEIGMQNIPTIQFKDIENSEQETFKWIKYIAKEGFCLVKNVPPEIGVLKELALKVSHLEVSNFGEVMDVKDTGEWNAANTHYKLPLHQDQPNYETPPGIQFLHCLQFDECVTGGESKLTDLFQIVEILRKESPDDFQTLVEVPSIFTAVDYPRQIYFESYKYNIVLDYFGKVVAVNWHPGLLTTAQVRECDVDRYYKAHKKLFEVIRREENQVEYRLQPGDMLCFSNRRMMHSREEFHSNGGMRFLQSCYVRADDLKCKYMTLAHKLGVKVAPPKVGNSSSI